MKWEVQPPPPTLLTLFVNIFVLDRYPVIKYALFIALLKKSCEILVLVPFLLLFIYT